FASFVGDRGAIAYFCGIEGEDGRRCRTAQDRWADNLLFAGFLQDLIAHLEDLYARTDLPRDTILARREVLFQNARDRFRAEIQPAFRSYTFGSFLTTPLNNATLIARRLYYDRLHLFDAAFERHGRDLPATIRAVAAAAEAARDDPYGALGRLAAPRGPPLPHPPAQPGRRGAPPSPPAVGRAPPPPPAPHTPPARRPGPQARPRPCRPPPP